MPETINISGGFGAYNETVNQQQIYFQWTCPNPFSVGMLFTTSPAYGMPGNYPTQIRIFPADNNWNISGGEVSYIYNQQNGIGNGWAEDQASAIGSGYQLGASVVFNPSPGQNYIIIINPRTVAFTTPGPPWVINMTWFEWNPQNCPCTALSTLSGACLVSNIFIGTNSCGGLSYQEIGTFARRPGYYTLIGCSTNASAGLMDLSGWPTCIPNWGPEQTYNEGDTAWDAGEGTAQAIASVPNTNPAPTQFTDTAYWHYEQLSEPPTDGLQAEWNKGGFNPPEISNGTANPTLVIPGEQPALGPNRNFTPAGYWITDAVGGWTGNVWYALQDVFPNEPGFDIAPPCYPPTLDNGCYPPNTLGSNWTGRYWRYSQGCGIGGTGSCNSCSFTDFLAPGALGINAATPGGYQLLYTDVTMSQFQLVDLIGVFKNNNPAIPQQWFLAAYIKNLFGAYGWDNVTISLSINGGGTLGSTLVTFGAGGTATAQQQIFIYFNLGKVPATPIGTLTFSRNGVVFGMIPNIPLYPLFSLVYQSFGTATPDVSSGPNLVYNSSWGGPNISLPGCTCLTGSILQVNPVAINSPIDDDQFAANWWGGYLQYQETISGNSSTLLYNGITCTGSTSMLLAAPTFNDPMFYISNPVTGNPLTFVLTTTPQFVVNGTVLVTYPAETLNITMSEFNTPTYTPVIPTMTSNTTPFGVASADSVQGGNEPWMAMRGSGLWESDFTGNDHWLQFANPTAVCLSRWSYSTNTLYFTEKFILQGSNDGSNWTTIDEQTTFAGTFNVNPGVYYYYFRILMPALQTGAQALIDTFQLYGLISNH